jgi:endonuclease/exonuclease/phosphatase (EEP) superfamily protein YafD
VTPKIAGAILLGLPLIALAWAFLWRRNRPVFWFALVLIAVSLGYLMATGATDDIADRLIPNISSPPPVRAK